MDRRCRRCGAGIAAGAAFCMSCGAPAQASGTSPTARGAGAGAAGKGSSLLKVLLIGAGLVALVGVMATAGLVYVGYRVKRGVERAAREWTPGSTPAPRVEAEAPVRRIDVCSLLSKEEASEILGVTVERVQSEDGAAESGCQYFVRPRSQEERAASVAAAFKDIGKRDGEPLPPGQNNPVEVMRRSGMEGFLKEIGGLASPDSPYLAVTVNWEGGRNAISMMKLTAGVSAPGLKTMEDLRGIGDEAVMGPADSVLAFVKGRTGVQIGLSLVPQGRDRGIAIARKIASRL